MQALKLSEHEALAAYGTIDASAIRTLLPGARGARHVRPVGRGALVRGRLGQVSAEAVTDVDPTGAGDAFLAGYAHARAQGMEPLRAGQAACEGVSALLADRARAAQRARA